jgi:inorganic triphosphatase YgiF
MASEIELKLRLPSNCVARVQRSALLKSLSISPSVTQNLYTIYYDTSNLDLRGNDIAFRLRRSGRHWIQSIKGGGSAAAGLHQRYEWEASLLKPQPDYTKISDPSLIRLFDNADLREQMRPLFITECKRRVRTLRLSGGGEAELCLDQGRIVAGGASMPFCEIELELKSGSPLPLFQLALDLLHTIPFRLENVSKAERGYTLALGVAPLPLKAKPVQLIAEMSVNEAFKAIAWNCLGHLHSNEAGMLQGGDIEYLHQMRVALRRLRSALNIFSRAFSKAAFAPMAHELRWLAGQFGPARDWDVFVAETLADIFPHFSDHPGMLPLQEKCEQIRRRHNDEARNAVESAHYTELMLKLGAWLSADSWVTSSDLMGLDNPTGVDRPGGSGGLGGPVKEFARTLLAHRHRQLKKYDRKLAKLSSPELHAVRILVKKQRYAGEFFAGFYPPKKVKAYIRSLMELQDLLGVVNDTAIIEHLLREVPDTGDERSEYEVVGIIRGWVASKALAKKLELTNAWANFDKSNPFW